MQTPSEIWIAGSTGLVGRATVPLLLAHQRARVFAVVRRPTALSHPRYEERVTDFEALEAELRGRPAEVAICTLGSTLKRAGSRENFRHIDHDYVLALGRAARASGVRHFLLVSALGADASSRFFYNRVKGEVEAGLTALEFPALTILRPSLLLGERDEVRVAERLFMPLSKMLPRAIAGIDVQNVARVLARCALGEASGVRVIPSRELHTLGAAE